MTSSRGLLLLLGWWESELQQKKVASSKRNPEGSDSCNGHGPGAQWCNLTREAHQDTISQHSKGP